ncbi:MAG: S41 family peptidase [Chloroflexi bacterium]|nr:S41 family peptidase [Chloroflexota bacterium]
MNRNTKSLFLLALILVFFLSAFSFFAGVGAAPFLSGGGGLQVNSGEIAAEFDKLPEIYAILKQDYVDKDTLTLKTLSEAAIKGMLSTLNDPFTNYLDASHYRAEMEFLSGKFEGIGAHVGLEDSKIVIISPMPGSPAEKSGIRAGDTILKINGESTAGLTLNETVTRIRGPKGTPVRLEVLHRGDAAPVELEVVRAEIEVKTVSSEMKEGIGILRISYFAEQTAEGFREEVQKLLAENPKGIVLDLRFNPGGLLDTVVRVSTPFLKQGDVVLHTVDSEKNKVTTTAQEDGILKDMPLAVLINEFSASGSEVMSGALQDNKRAVLFGTESFGKSAVNIIRPLSDGSALVVTTARWLTPEGRQIGKDKIRPDVEIKPAERPDDDVQLRAALDYLKK